MKVKIGGYTITLIDRDVKTAQKTIRHFLEVSKQESEKKGAESYYFTLLISMKLMSEAMINAITPETLNLLLNNAAEHFEEIESFNKK